VLHLRVITPADVADDVLDLLDADVGATNVVVLRGVARDPAGDLISADVAREAANDVLDGLSGLGLRERGSITLQEIDTALSAAVDRAEQGAPGHGQDAVVWEQVESTINEESALSVAFLTFLTIATMIAGIGVLLDEPILIVGAMVVGPEFGPLAGICVALVQRQWQQLRRSVRALVVGFPTAIAVTILATLLGRAVGLVDPEMLDRNRPFTEFISQPDWFSFIVAFLAAIAGMISLTSSKSGALIGVLISVTTVPAAGNIAVALALGNPGLAGGSAEQLLINLTGIIASGTLTLLVQRWAWRRTPATSGR
jgi:uncharacterized hydrophobic protein (TIGR00271 family)